MKTRLHSFVISLVLLVVGSPVLFAAPQIQVVRGSTTFVDGVTKLSFVEMLDATHVRVVYVLTIKNVGNAALNLGHNPVIDGPGAADYSKAFASGSETFVVLPGQSTNLNVTILGGTATNHEATLHILSDDPANPSFDIPLVAPEMTVLEQPDGNELFSAVVSGFINITPPIALGRAGGAGAGLAVIKLINTGSAPLTGLQLGKDDGINDGVTIPESDYTVTGLDNHYQSLAPGASMLINVKLNANKTGAHRARIYMASNDVNEGPPFNYQIYLTAPEISVEHPSSAALKDGAATLDFGSLGGGAPNVAIVTIKNDGSANLSGLSVTKSGSGAADYTLGALGTTSLVPNASTTFTVTFDPSSQGSHLANLQIQSNDADEGTFDIFLKAPEIAVEQPANTNLVDGAAVVGFNDAAVGKSSMLTFTVKSKGSAALTGAVVTKDGANSGDFAVTGPSVAPIAANGSTTFTVKFTPSAAGARTAAIHIASNDGDENAFDIALMGAGVNPPVVNAAGPFTWFVSGNVTDQITATNNPTSFTITNLPAAVTYNKTTGQLSGKPGAATTATKTFTVVASNVAGPSAAVTFNYTVTALPALSVGTFNGLIDRSTLLTGPVVGQMLKGHGGSLSNLITTSAGTFTGTLKLEDKSYSMPAGSALNAAAGGNPTASVKILRGTATDAIADLTFAFAINKDTGELTGTLSDGIIVTPVALKAWRSPWKATGTVASPANPATAASYTAALELDPALVGTDPLSAPPGNPANVAYPQGTGYGTLTITTAGVATWSGKAADGTPLTASTMLGPNGEVPLHFLLYSSTAPANAGSLHGWTKITGVNLDSVAPFDWLKLAQLPANTTRSYKDGFPLHNLTVIGSKYVPPTMVNLMLGLLAPPNNAQLVFSEGGIKDSTLGVSGALTQVFGISTTNVVDMPKGLTNNPGTVTMTPFSATTGAISGNFTLSGSPARSVPWSGVLVPRLSKGVGQFQLAKLPNPTTSPQLSGQVVLEAKP